MASISPETALLRPSRARRNQSGALPVACRVDGAGLLESGGRRGLRNVGGFDVTVASSLRGEQPDHAVIGQGSDGINEGIDEIAIVIAEPQQHNVNDLIGVFVEQFRAGGSHDSRSQRLVAVIVIAQFLDQLAVFNTGQGIPAHQFLRYVLGTTGQPRGCSSSD